MSTNNWSAGQEFYCPLGKGSAGLSFPNKAITPATHCDFLCYCIIAKLLIVYKLPR